MPEIGISTGQATSHLPQPRQSKEGRWVIPELSRASQVDEAVEAVSVSLKDDDMKAIEEALAGSEKS